MIELCLGITALVTTIDLAIKHWVEKHMTFQREEPLPGGVGSLRRVHNKGMMLNIGDGKPNLVKYLSLVVMILVSGVQVCLLGKKGYTNEKIGLALILGGAISNTYDRVKRGFVVDFIGFNFKNKKLSSVTYNLGDFAIFLGGAVTVCTTLFSKK